MLERGDGRFGLGDALRLHEWIWVRALFDAHRHFCYNPTGAAPVGVVWACRQTRRVWESRPEVTLTSPHVDLGFRYGSEGKLGVANCLSHGANRPVHGGAFCRVSADLAPGLVREAEARDSAARQLRQGLGRYALLLAAVLGLEVDT